MHIEYAADAFVRMQKPKYSEPLTDFQLISAYVTEKEFLSLADKIGGVTSDISKSVRATLEAGRNSYKKVTSKQKDALAAALLDKYKTALTCYAAAYGVTEDEFIANAGK